MSKENACSIEKTLDKIEDETLRKEIEKYIVQNLFPIPIHKAALALKKAMDEGRFEMYVGYRIWKE